MVDAVIYEVLSGDSGLAGLVGDRITPAKATQNSDLPRVTYGTIATERQRHLKGRSDLARHTVQIEVWGRTFKHVADIRSAVLALLECYRGEGIRGCFLSDQIQQETDTGYSATLIFTVWSQE